ncbi:MAG: threonine--tRNA ligase [Candidatus Eremiobacteraeota bacterium]|nr:threonine--tRNA ligase [Candidatus Eremiobacteraeota bacterium]MBV8263766.1 threonine--tRNA ligase [Candidatus Eremiobacteraeota bacterium]MBV8669630.1 threonine--tRNA ligase [Candidatus Eremiobacteraeota bacterium]
MSTSNDLAPLRHTAAHLLAHAVVDIFGDDVQLAIGPAIDNGFYYDFHKQTPFVPEDLPRLENRMRELIARDLKMQGKPISRAEAESYYTQRKQPFKLDILHGIPDGEPLTMYAIGDFTDLCRGGHVDSSAAVGAVKLLSIAGAYWRGDEHNPMLQRIYGTAFPTQAELDAYLAHIAEAERRDHRKLGRELDLFSIEEDAGAGLIFWHPKGGIIRRKMEDWLREALTRRGYDIVFTPHVMRRELWNTSGHTGFYAENMFGPMEVEKEQYQLKPMNCPGHILIYKSRRRSYRELPVRLAELGTVYRYERSGVLHGLLRVRGFTQDDAHIFCMPSQIEREIEDCVDFAWEVLRVFGFDSYKVELSARDPQKPMEYAGTDEEWARAEGALKNTLDRMQVPYSYMPGEAVFYGPKIDVKLVDAIGRPWQLTTVQFDFNLPRRFELEYVAEDGSLQRPLMVHRALWGSVERFFGVLIEHYAGAFPTWLAPVQAVVLPITDVQVPYARTVQAALGDAGLRVDVDDSNERLQKKIRNQQLLKVPYMLVAGKNEVEAGTVNVRDRSGAQATMAVAAFKDKLAGEAIARK